MSLLNLKELIRRPPQGRLSPVLRPSYPAARMGWTGQILIRVHGVGIVGMGRDMGCGGGTGQERGDIRSQKAHSLRGMPRVAL